MAKVVCELIDPVVISGKRPCGERRPIGIAFFTSLSYTRDCPALLDKTFVILIGLQITY